MTYREITQNFPSLILEAICDECGKAGGPALGTIYRVKLLAPGSHLVFTPDDARLYDQPESRFCEECLRDKMFE